MPEITDVSPIWLNTDASSTGQCVTGRMLSIACTPDGQTIYVGSYSNLWVSSDSGQTWNQLAWPQPAPDQFDVPGAIGGWCVVDIAAALGWRVDRHPRCLSHFARGGYAGIVGFGDCGVWTALGKGNGWFQDPNVVIAGYGYDAGGWRVDRHVRAVADLTGKGHADIVGFGDAGVWTVLGNADGTYQSEKFVIANFGYAAGGWRVDRHPRFVVDLTGKGHADIIGFGDAGVWTALGNGDGTFQEPKFVLANFGYVAGGWRVDRHPRFVVDLTGDGRADIIGFGDAGVWTALGNGDGTFQAPKFVLANFGYAAGAWRVDRHPRLLADLTGNGHADIIGFGDAGVWTALGKGDGTFQDAKFVLANFGYEAGMWRVDRHPRFVMDLTGNGHADIVGFGDAGVWTALGNGDGTFQEGSFVLPSFGYGTTVLALTQVDRAAGSRGVWRSTDGGANWTQVYAFSADEVGGQLEWALGSDHLVYVAVGNGLLISKDAGISFRKVTPLGSGVAQQANHVAVWQNAPADPAPWMIYVLGQGSMAFSADGGATWFQDHGAVPPNIGGQLSITANGNAARVMVVSPRQPIEVYVTADGSNSPAIWRADYTPFVFGTPQATWEQIVLPELGGQDSGNVFLGATRKGGGDLLFYGSQRSRGYIGPLEPASASDWLALDANIHVDLHGVLLSPDFTAVMRNGAYQSVTGTIWLLTDGGISRSTDGGRTFHTTNNARTLSCVNVAGVANPGQGPAFSLNAGDNSGFYSMDGGQHWSYQQYGGGDNDCSFADPLRAHAMLIFTPRWGTDGQLADHTRDGQTVAVYQTDPGKLPDGRAGTQDRRVVTGPPLLPSDAPWHDLWNADSSYGSRGSRPIVRGLPGEPAPDQGDYVFILFFAGGMSQVVRTQNILDIASRDEWATTATGPGQGANVYLQGPALPYPNLGIVQASGGHAATVFYVGGGYGQKRFGLWTWTAGATSWQQLVPGGGAIDAVRFFVDPYRPRLIYILDDDHVKRSDDGGRTWQIDQNLETQLTWGGRIAISSDDVSSGIGDYFDLVLTDMQFDPGNPLVRFAVGEGGAFMTVDGVNWTCLLHAGALTGRPTNCYYDWISNPADPALYVSFAGRSLVKITQLPTSVIARREG